MEMRKNMPKPYKKLGRDQKKAYLEKIIQYYEKMSDIENKINRGISEEDLQNMPEEIQLSKPYKKLSRKEKKEYLKKLIQYYEKMSDIENEINRGLRRNDGKTTEPRRRMQGIEPTVTMKYIIDNVAKGLGINSNIIKNPILRKEIKQLIEIVGRMNEGCGEIVDKVKNGELSINDPSLEAYIEEIVRVIKENDNWKEYIYMLAQVNTHKNGGRPYLRIFFNDELGNLKLNSTATYRNFYIGIRQEYCPTSDEEIMELRIVKTSHKPIVGDSLRVCRIEKCNIFYNKYGIEIKRKETQKKGQNCQIYTRDCKNPFIVKCIIKSKKGTTIYYKVLREKIIQLHTTQKSKEDSFQEEAIFDSREEAINFFEKNRGDLLKIALYESYSLTGKDKTGDGTGVMLGSFLKENGFDIEEFQNIR